MLLLKKKGANRKILEGKAGIMKNKENRTGLREGVKL